MLQVDVVPRSRRVIDHRHRNHHDNDAMFPSQTRRRVVGIVGSVPEPV